MSALTVRAPSAPLRFNLVVPDIRWPVNLAGQIGEILRPMFVAEPESGFGGAASSLVRFRCALGPDEGVGAVLEVLSFKGFVGFANDGGELRLSVPPQFGAAAKLRLGSAVARSATGTAHDPRRGAVPVTDLWVRLVPGRRLALPLGFLGECALEAA